MSMGKRALIIFLYLSKFVAMISNQRRPLLLTLLFLRSLVLTDVDSPSVDYIKYINDTALLT